MIRTDLCTIYDSLRRHVQPLLVIVTILGLAAFLGMRASVGILALLIVVGGGVVVLQRPVLALPTLVAVALLVQLKLGTGTEVELNLVTLLIPVFLALWVLDMVRRRELCLVPSRTTKPLALFLLAGLFSLLVGNVLWDAAVPRSGSLILVQVAQWAIFAFSAGAFWLTGNLARGEVELRRLTLVLVVIAGSLAVLFVLSGLLKLPEFGARVNRIATHALHRAPFWMLLTATVGGQLLFNRELSVGWHLFLLVTFGAVLVYAFYLQRATASNWVGVATAVGVLAWLRWPRLRRLVVVLLLVLAATGFLTSAVYEFAGGTDEWEESGGSRLALINRVVEVTMRNPVTGLGPASYRAYARMKPLPYMRALWFEPNISSHNNYVDLFSHVGVLGLGLFAWFAAELTGLGLHLRTRFTTGFAAGYVNAMLAAWAGALMLMLFADWILPFVYNIGFSGFQASVLVWLFLGGLVSLERIAQSEMGA